MPAVCCSGSQAAGDSQVTFSVTVLSPPILYNRSQGKSGRKGAAMNGKTAGNRSPRLAVALTVVAVVALLAATFRVHVQTYTSYPAGPAGSAAYRQEVAFVQCLRSHGVPGVHGPPPPGGSVNLQGSQEAVRACQRLAPRGRQTSKVQIVL
jgi:hypothetical protein